jgi:hypothetical protein
LSEAARLIFADLRQILGGLKPACDVFIRMVGHSFPYFGERLSRVNIDTTAQPNNNPTQREQHLGEFL